MAAATSDDVRALLQLLTQSMSALEPTRSASEKQLEQIQSQALSAAFIRALCDHIVLVPDETGGIANGNHVEQMDGNLRLMACIWLKHFAKKQWKQTTRAWSDAERVELRQRLLFAALHEPNTTIALHLALILANIARGEFPTQWTFEQLFPPMLELLQQAQTDMTSAVIVRRRRRIDLTYRIVKELATRRLMMHRKQFAMLSVEILPLVLQHWCATAQCVDVSTVTIDLVAMLLTNTKLVSTILMNAFRDLAMLQGGEIVQAALVQFYEQLERLVGVRRAVHQSAPDSEMVVLLDKVCFRVASLIVGIQKGYPIEFRAYLTPFLNLFWNILVIPMEGGGPATSLAISKRLQIESLQFFANVLSCRLYTRDSLSSALTGESTSLITKVITATGDVALTDAMVLEAQAAMDGFFGESNRFATLLQLVVLHYMKLQPSDLEEWRNDPEGFVILSESLTAQESVRACAENLFLTLIQNFRDQTIPVLTQLTSATSTWLEELSNQGGNPDTRKILDIDAVLLAIGLGCYDLHDCFDFEPWFLGQLVPLLVNPAAVALGSVEGIPVLRYRVVWLVSCWLAQLSANIRVSLYDALLNAPAFFQSPDADMALQLRIVQTLECMVTDWGFSADSFVMFLPRALECLYSFFPQTAESESKMKVLSCLEAIIQACQAQCLAFSEQISAPLPTMWNSGGEAENLVRGKILQLLAKLLASVRACDDDTVLTQHASQIQTVHAMCLQVVRFATDVSNPDEVFLMESGLELWNETIELVGDGGYTEELHLIFSNALRLMERDYEHVKLVMTLLEGYIRLGKGQFWQAYHSGVEQLLLNVVGNVKAEASLQIATTVESIVTSFPSEQLLGSTPIIRKFIQGCLAFKQKDLEREPESVIVAYIGVLARILIGHLEWLVVHVVQNDLEMLASILDLMLNNFFHGIAKSMALRRRKLWALGLCASLEILDQRILDKVGQIVECCVEVLDEEQDEAESDRNEDDDCVAGGAFRAYKSHRRKQRATGGADTVDTEIQGTNLKLLVCSKLSALSSKLGPDSFGRLLQTVDSSVMTKLQ